MVADNLCVHCNAAPRAGTSKYCRDCRKVARAAWLKMIQEKTAEREAKRTGFRDLVTRAAQAGAAAADAVVPRPMTVCTTGGVPIETVLEGACGFAWITVRPGTSSFARWLVKENIGHADSYAGGVRISVSAYGQSIQRKEAYAQAYTNVLREAGVEAYANSRLD